MTTQQIDREEAIIMAPEIRQKLHDAQKYAAGLELNLAAVIQRADAAEKALEKMDSAHTKTLLSLYEVKDALAKCTCSHQRTDVAPKSLWCPDVKSPR
jgi:hypothetical protein